MGVFALLLVLLLCNAVPAVVLYMMLYMYMRGTYESYSSSFSGSSQSGLWYFVASCAFQRKSVSGPA
jgi:hypothetical protein